MVARFQHWSHMVAGSMTDPNGLLYDDLVQEGLIEIWRTAEKIEDPSAVYLTKAARYRMQDVVTGNRPMTGGDSAPGPKYRPVTTAVDWAEVGDDDPNWAYLLEAADLLDAVDWAYHEGDILRALDTLRPDYRQYVVLKYWHGLRDVEIEQHMGVSRKVIGTWWSRSIKPALQRELAHLGAP